MGEKKSHFIRNAFIILIVFSLALAASGCGSKTDDSSKDKSKQTTIENEHGTFEPVSYTDAYNWIKDTEQRIQDVNRGVKPNKYGETAAEKIIYSDEYSALYCSYWSALEEIGTPGDSRFEKTKLRWQTDYTDENIKKRLLDAFYSEGEEAFYNKYGDIYQDEVFPACEARWRAGQ